MKTKGIYFLYRLLQAFGLPVLILYFLVRGLRRPSYWSSLPQRFGFLPPSYQQTGPGAIWLHAVSVGEVLTCIELLRQLHAEFPRSRLFVSSSTLAGYAAANEKLRRLANGVFYAPVDYCFAVRRVLRMLRPSLVVVAETEIWPNLFREVKRLEAGLAIVNGRISDRALPRYLPRRWFFKHVLRHADAVLAQNETMRDRFVAIGAPPDRVTAAGNLKYDFQPREAAPDSPVRAWIERVRPAAVWIAASTMPPAESGDVDEDDAVIAAFGELARRYPRLLVVLVPRRPERFDEAARKLAAAGVPFARRTALPETVQLPGVLLLDSIGELSGLFPLATVVFMGGTLARRGGHNILEPAFFARPIAVGPHMENFQEIADDFRAARACADVPSPAALASVIGDLLGDREGALALGRRALECAESRRGSTARTVAHLRELYDRGVPRFRPPWPWFPVAWLLARVWRWGGRRRLRRFVRQRRSLGVPVISIGNITMGGTGKTPCALMLAKALRSLGRRPGILTRGYGRASTEKQVVLPPGATISTDETGDEAQILLRSGVAPVGIGPDRLATGQALLAQFGPDVILLDDAFQHVRVSRQIDIVMIDALNPFGGRELFPLGRMREPIAGLGRADIFIINRGQFSDLVPAIERTLRYWNHRAPIFHAALRGTAWIEHRTSRRLPVDAAPFTRVLAFCGIGNPHSFRRTLEALSIEVAEWVEFEDHHRYRPHELRRIAHLAALAGVAALVTTEKDAINLCQECDDLLAPFPLYWLQVEMELDREPEFLSLINARLRFTQPV